MRTRLLAFVIALVGLASPSEAQLLFEPPEPVGIRPGGETLDWSPTLSDDRLEVYFAHFLTSSNSDIWWSRRDSVNDEWESPQSLGGVVNSAWRDDSPTLSANSLSMVFSSLRAGGFGSWDLYETTRERLGDPWSEPVNLGSVINTPDSEGSVAISLDGSRLYFAGGCCLNTGESDIWVSNLLDDGEWSEPENLEIEADGNEIYPRLSPDQNWLYITSGSSGSEDTWVARRDPETDRFAAPIRLGKDVNSSGIDFSPFVASDGSLYYVRNASWDGPPWVIYQAQPRATDGDVDQDGQLASADIDQVTRVIADDTYDLLSDLDQSGSVDLADHTLWVKEVKRTWFGDANLDGEFDSSDILQVFSAGQYEDLVEDNSTWGTGDWNADREFNTSDLVVAFQDGGYEQGQLGAVHAVPEPSTIILVMISLIGSAIRRRHTGQRSHDV